MRIAQRGETLLHLDLRAPHQPAHRLAEEQVSAQFRGQPVAAEKLRAARRREMVQRLVLLAKAPAPALHIRQPDRRPHDLEARRELPRRIEAAIEDRLLKTPRPLLATRVHEKQLAEIVLAQPPLPAVPRDLLLHRARGRPAQAVVVVGRVEAVIERPDQPVRLMLEISPAPASDVKRLLFVRDAVAIRVGVDEEIVRVCLAHDDAPLVQRHEHPRQHELVDENRVLVIHAVAFRRPVQGDAADLVELVLAIDVLHVAAQLGDKHPPVAIERDHARLLDVRLAQHQLKLVAGRELEGLEFVLRAQRLHRRLGGKLFRFRCRRVRGEKAGAERGEGEG